MQPGLDRPDLRARHGGNLRKRQPFILKQDERFALERRESRNGSGDQSRYLFVEKLSERLFARRQSRLCCQFFDRHLLLSPAKMLHGEIARRRIEICAEARAFGVEVVWLPNQTEEEVVRHVLGQLDRTQQAKGKTKHGVAVTLVQLQKCRFVAATG